MYRTFLHSACNCEYLQKWNSGTRLRTAADGVAELIGRGVVARIAARERSYLGVCLASPAAWVLAGGLLIAMYYYIMNVHMKKMFGDYNQKV